MLGKFTDLILAQSFSSRTVKMSALIKGDDGYIWVVTMREMEKLIAQQYLVLDK